jgi:ketosteroid isomerase-like protein
MIGTARNLALGILLLSPCLVAQAPARIGGHQPTSPLAPSLQSQIVVADSALFAAFNARDLNRFHTFFARDLEFYQDNEGVENYAQTMRDFAQMFAQSAQIRRSLVPGTLEVYPVKNYGAIEIGSHQFCHAENGKDECGTFRFVHIWKRTRAGWRITRVVSYAH